MFICMMKKSTFLQVLHSIAKFFDRRAGQDLNNTVVGFVGERTRYQGPHLVILPVRNTWAWTTVTASTNELDGEMFYAAAADKRVSWVPTNDTNKQAIPLPSLLFLPSILGEFVLSQKRTPWELREEVKRLVADDMCLVIAEDAELILDWLLVA